MRDGKGLQAIEFEEGTIYRRVSYEVIDLVVRSCSPLRLVDKGRCASEGIVNVSNEFGI